MLEIRLNCEHCDTHLPNHSKEAMICSYECTFCKSCVDEVLKNVCPNCGGGFEKRPVRPQTELENNPARKDKVFKPVIENRFTEKNLNIPPHKR